jgi:hypothetical protein
MTDHAAMSPSSAAMWMGCPASITKADGVTRPSSQYAREGTAAHRIAEKIIGGDLFPPGKITVEGQQFIVGLPMLRALNPYIHFVQGLQKTCSEVHVETKVFLGADRKKSLVWGTTDCAARQDMNLHVADLKYGMGVPVEPNSAQLKIYALSAINTLWREYLFDTVYLTVVQPRLDPKPKTHVVAMEELYDWNQRLLRPAIRAIKKGDETEKVGPYCRWCVRKPDCDAFKSYKSSMAADIFDDGVDILNV